MKYFLLPVTAILYYVITFLSLTALLYVASSVFDLNIVMFILFFGVITALISLLFSFSASISVLVNSLYKNSWVSVILHFIVGVYAVINTVDFYMKDDKFMNTITSMWDESVFKTISLAPLFISIFVGIVYVVVVLPLYVKATYKE